MKAILIALLLLSALPASARTRLCTTTLLACGPSNPNCNTVTCRDVPGFIDNMGIEVPGQTSDNNGVEVMPYWTKQDRAGWPTHLAIAGYLTLSGVALSTSAYLFGARQGRERNPALASFERHPVALGAVKTGLAVLAGSALWHLHRSHLRRAFLFAVMASGVYGVVVAHNVRVGRGGA